ncbi:MAG: M20 family metallopeptidase [Lachnospiraceae bacterium]|nr:M20 family metallopeptidase [Lachnospiraceae bacterium]
MIKESLEKALVPLMPQLIAISDYIYDNPELGHEEFKACDLLCRTLEDNGFDVVRGAADIPTAFSAELKGRPGGPVIAFVAEYDALPEMGHGCGHQIIASGALGAALALKTMMPSLTGTIRVVGTPAEDSTSDKVDMIARGVFEDVDFSFQCHANDRTMSDARFKAITKREFIFHGVASHASRAPEKGISACDAAVLGYMGVEMLREHVRDDVRIHGIINKGGSSPNTVPDYASVEYGIRADDSRYLREVVTRVENCFRGAALATGAELEIVEGKTIESNLRVPALNSLLLAHAVDGGADQILPQTTMASTDFCNLTRIMPAARLDIAFAPVGTSTHSPAFTAAGKTDMAHRAIHAAAYAMAAAAYDLMTDPQLAKRIRAEFEALKNE